MKSKVVAFIHANIIPMDEERVLTDQVLVAQDGRITEVGDFSQVTIPGSADQVDATNKFLIPAMADMHIHLEGDAWNMMFPPERQFSKKDLDFEKILFPYLAYGITTAQVMSALPEHISLRDQINRGEILGPRLILTRMIDGPGPTWPPPINKLVATADEARQAVVESKKAGYDGMKVYSFLSRECYDAIVSTAQEVGMPVIGHVPNALSVEYVLEARQKLIAHTEEVMKHAHGDYTPRRIEYYADLIARSGTWITPTLTTSRKILSIFDSLENELSRPEMRFLHPMARGVWTYLVQNMYLPIGQEHRRSLRKGFEEFQRPLTKVLHDHGARLMVGTDVLIPTNIPGLSLHDELKEITEVGLTPFEALKTATVHPREYLDEISEAGTIEPGKRADLVLLEANPLEAIGNARKIAGILYRGEWMDLEEIERRLDH